MFTAGSAADADVPESTGSATAIRRSSGGYRGPWWRSGVKTSRSPNIAGVALLPPYRAHWWSARTQSTQITAQGLAEAFLTAMARTSFSEAAPSKASSGYSYWAPTLAERSRPPLNQIVEPVTAPLGAGATCGAA